MVNKLDFKINILLIFTLHFCLNQILLCIAATISAQEEVETNFPSFRLEATRRIKVEQDKGNIPATRRRLVAKRPMEATTSDTPSVAPITEASPVTVATTDTPDLVVYSEASIEEPQLTQIPTCFKCLYLSCLVRSK